MAVQNQQVLSHAACWPSADERVNCESMVNVWSSVCTHTFVCSAIASQVSPALPSSTRPTITCISDLIAYLTVFYTCQVEYERVKEAYVNMTHSLEASAAEKRALEVRLGQAAADASRDARERRCARLISCGTETFLERYLERPTTGCVSGNNFVWWPYAGMQSQPPNISACALVSPCSCRTLVDWKPA